MRRETYRCPNCGSDAMAQGACTSCGYAFVIVTSPQEVLHFGLDRGSDEK